MRSLLTAVVVVACCVTGAFAADSATADKPAATNTTCPTCDAAIDPATSTTVVVKGADGKDHALACCCKDCAADLEKDPTKYVGPSSGSSIDKAGDKAGAKSE